MAVFFTLISIMSAFWANGAYAQQGVPPHAPPRQVPVADSARDTQEVMKKVDGLVNQLTGLGNSLHEGIPEGEMKKTMGDIEKAVGNASKFLSPESGIGQTSERIQAKLQDALEQLHDQMTRVNQGQGSAGIMLHDPEFQQALKEVQAKYAALSAHRNHLRFVLDIGLQEIRGYQEGTSRAYFNLQIWPTPEHYYLLGVASDPRGTLSVTNIKTTGQNGVVTNSSTTQVNETGFVVSGMIGKLFFNKRLDLSIGVLYGDLAVSVAGNLAPESVGIDRLCLRMDFYSHGIGYPSDQRLSLVVRPVPAIYLMGGTDGFNTVNGIFPWMYGVGLTFDDDDIKFLFDNYLANAI